MSNNANNCFVDLNKCANIFLSIYFRIILNSHLDINKAKKEFETLLMCQDQDGSISVTNNWLKKHSEEFNSFIKLDECIVISAITQLPLIAQALKAISAKNWDKTFILKYLPKVNKFYDWLHESRINKGEKIPLLNIIHTMESGANNSPIYDKALKIKDSEKLTRSKWMDILNKQFNDVKNCKSQLNIMREFDGFWFKDLLFNCVFVQGYRDLAFMHHEIGNKKESEECKKKARTLEKTIIKYCWNSKKNFFFGYEKENLMNDVKTSLSFSPLILDGLPQNIACKLVDEHLLCEEEFWTEFPIPSVAINEPNYSENEFFSWRGPTNIIGNWFIINGLRKHGFENLAVELSKKTVNLVKKRGFYECYSPTTGKGMGAKNFASSKLIVDIERLPLNNIHADLDFLLDREYLRVKKGGFS